MILLCFHLSGAGGSGSDSGRVSGGFGLPAEDMGSRAGRELGVLPLGQRLCWRARRGAAQPELAMCVPCPSGIFVFQDFFCQRQQLCGKDEEDGEFSPCLCPLWGGEGVMALVDRGGGHLHWTGGKSGRKHSRLTKASKLLCLARTAYSVSLAPPSDTGRGGGPPLSLCVLPVQAQRRAEGCKPHNSCGQSTATVFFVFKYFILWESAAFTCLKSQTDCSGGSLSPVTASHHHCS